MRKSDRKIRFTKEAIDALASPTDGKRKYYYDTRIMGFAVAVQPSGVKSFYLYRKVNKKPQRVLLGRFPDMSVEQARKKAESLIGDIVQGLDPAEKRARERAEWTFDQLFDWYLVHHAKEHKTSWIRDAQNYNNHLKARLGSFPVTKITGAIVREAHMAVRASAGPYAANRVLALVSVVYSAADELQVYQGLNPAKGIKPYHEESRDRRLSDAEMPRLLSALEEESNTTIRDFIFMLLFTAARRDNVLSMRWEQIDLESGTWRIPMTKNKTPQNVPLEPEEIELLRRRREEVGNSPWVFPGRKDTKTGHLENPYEGWYRICERAGLGSKDENGKFRANIRLHDLRRTHGSIAADSGVSLHMIGSMLNQKSPAITSIYARLSLNPIRLAKRKVLDAMLLADESHG